MSAYLVGQIHINDHALWAAYVAGVGRSLEGLDAEIVFRGTKVGELAGTQPRAAVVVIRFATVAELERWHDGDAYQALVPLRDRAADVVITAYEAG